MNRKIKLRGKGIEEYDKDKWYYGSYFKYDEINYFCLDDGSRTEEINEKLKNNIKHKIIFEMQGDLNMENHIKLADVNPETVGQYTELDDKNGKEIYEGDIVGDNKIKWIVKWNKHRMGFSLYPTTEQLYDEMPINVENKLGFKILGNIYDNPELLEGE